MYNSGVINIRKSIFSVYTGLGPGLLEKVYEKVLAYELENIGLKVETQVPMKIKYRGHFY
ncbi:GxxExxY protein [Chryseobacterium sp. c4a]|uniref:GxxExxY protein n=1 Tax=Chryseobacterium sp. c4a TaxID=1573582 RepID=UPI00293BBC14|nr:GxxExxY protein [Chryseobacterium sp. c4a]